jgi:hypothetical protein
MKNKYQVVVVQLSDGRVGFFTGPVLVNPEDTGKVTISDIKFEEPKDLPEGMSFESPE